MPARYVKIRDELIESGSSEKDAKAQAAAIYNDTRKADEAELTSDYDSKHPYKGKKVKYKK